MAPMMPPGGGGMPPMPEELMMAMMGMPTGVGPQSGSGMPPMGPEGLAMPPGAPPMDPMAMAGGGMPMEGMVPPMGMEAGASPFPSTDPGVISEILSMLMGMREQDHASLEMQQDEVLMGILQAMGIGGVDPMSGFAEGGMPPMPMDEQMPPSTPAF